MVYAEVTFKLSVVDPYADLLKDDLCQIEFESFVDTAEGFKGYIPESLFAENNIDHLLSSFQQDYTIEISYQHELLPEQNWNAVWESSYEPVDIGNFCHVHAPFHQPSSTATYNIEIQPSMSFGTAHHATTHLMMELLHSSDVQNKKVMDMGCGTGLLAIFAALKGAAYIEAIDIEHQAYVNTLENIERNHTAHIIAKEGDAHSISDTIFDLFMANIHRNILIRDLKTYSKHIVSGGSLLVSGFFDHDVPALTSEANSKGFRQEQVVVMNQWAAIRYTKV